jgi:hypothetical protein
MSGSTGRQARTRRRAGRGAALGAMRSAPCRCLAAHRMSCIRRRRTAPLRAAPGRRGLSTRRPLAAEPGPSTITPDSIVAMPLGLRRRDILVGTGCLALAVGVGLLTAWQELGFLATLGLTLAGGAALGRVLLPRHDLKVAYLAVLAMAMAWSGVIFGHRPLVIAIHAGDPAGPSRRRHAAAIVDPSGFTTNIDLIAHGTVGTESRGVTSRSRRSSPATPPTGPSSRGRCAATARPTARSSWPMSRRCYSPPAATATTPRASGSWSSRVSGP